MFHGIYDLVLCFEGFLTSFQKLL